MDEQEITRIAEAIRHYVATRAQAADTEKGIAEWWLGNGPKAERGHLRAALDRLVGEGVLECERPARGHLIYRARRGCEG